MGAFSIQHWVMVILVVLLLFGASRLGDVGKGLGEGIRNFKKGLGGDDEPSNAIRSAKAGAVDDGSSNAAATSDTGDRKAS
jgi:sec-independent protein translocase protein TatA